MNSTKKSIITLSILALAACGGGSSSVDGGVVPPTTPPSSNFALEASVPYQPVLEKNIFTIEVSNSAFDLQVIQISGPTAKKLDNSQSATSTWLAPSLEYDAVEEMVFEITANDSLGNPGTAIVAVDLRGFSGPGKPIALLDTGIELLAGNVGVPAFIGGGLNSSIPQVIGSLPQFPDSDDNQRKFVFIGGATDGFFSHRIDDRVISEETFSSSSFFEVGTLSFNLQGNSSSGGNNFVLLDEDEDLFRYFIDTESFPPYSVVEKESFAIENPCYVAERVNTGQDFIWIGQRNSGLSLIRLLLSGDGQFGTEIIDAVGGDRSLCHIVTTKLAERLSPNDSELSDIITVDFDTNEIVLFGDIGEDGQYDELEIIPIKTETSANLSIVNVFSRGTESQSPNYLVILLADEQSFGDHRLVLIAQNEDDREIVQTVYPLNAGRPIALIDGAFIGERPSDEVARDIVVVTENSGSFILEYIEGPTTSTPPYYGQPIFFDTGAGAGSAVTAFQSNDLDNIDNNVVLVAYPETGIVREFKPLIEISD